LLNKDEVSEFKVLEIWIKLFLALAESIFDVPISGAPDKSDLAICLLKQGGATTAKDW